MASPDLPPPPAATPIIRRTRHTHTETRTRQQRRTTTIRSRPTASLIIIGLDLPSTQPATSVATWTTVASLFRHPPRAHLLPGIGRRRKIRCSNAASAAMQQAPARVSLARRCGGRQLMCDVTGWPLGLPQPTHSPTDCPCSGGGGEEATFCCALCARETRQAESPALRRR